ncbi:hypothetical protein [Undibacterium sp. WLHG33]|uniref:hypothetical protein n=1 Tax=Undibacterium sp. WLHG33 TaxID=3412482 RepID=UPI003C2E14AD
MNPSLNDAKPGQACSYISEVFRPCRELGAWDAAATLPLYLQANWIFRRIDVAGMECLLIWDAWGEQQETASNLRKHIEKLRASTTMPIIYGVSDTTSFHRKRMIDQGIAFVVPGKQLYLPFAALDLRENFAAYKSQPVSRLSACAQQLVLLECLGYWQPQCPAQEWAARLGLSKMTVSRAYSELDALGIAHFELLGRQTNLYFKDRGQVLWERALPHLSSPVKREVNMSRRIYQECRDRFQWMQQELVNLECAAGEWALSKLGMLASPKQACFALGKLEWEWFTKFSPAIEDARYDEDVVHIQAWRYDPNFPKDHRQNLHTVDPLSLYLSLQDMKDDRIQIALDELLAQVWNRVEKKS